MMRVPNMLDSHEFYKSYFRHLGRTFDAMFEESNSDDVRNDPHLSSMGVVARQIREENGLTQHEVAKRGKITLRFVQRLESDQLEEYELFQIYRLSIGLGISIKEFYSRLGPLHPFNVKDCHQYPTYQTRADTGEKARTET
jgi:transcriptional regulator with XRE-family HTH domain